MGSGIYSALSGGLAFMQRMEVAVNNLANSGSFGFKASRLSFETLVDAETQNRRSQGINFCRTSAQFIDFSQAEIMQTQRSLDLAIKGDAFFKVAGKDGFFYTRQGNFRLDNQGNLVTNTGMQVVGESGPVNLPDRDVRIDPRGRVTAGGGQVAQIDVYRIPEKKALIQRPNGMFELIEGGTEEPAAEARIIQGGLEQANVNSLRLAAELTQVQRAYAAYMKTMKVYGELGEKAVQIGRIG